MINTSNSFSTLACSLRDSGTYLTKFFHVLGFDLDPTIGSSARLIRTVRILDNSIGGNTLQVLSPPGLQTYRDQKCNFLEAIPFGDNFS
jgi:hypothetical protein